jgi:phage shock protein PspC (stress-responsive transcriptional regulator)
MNLTILFALMAFLILLVIIKKNRKEQVVFSNKHSNIKYYKPRWWWNIDAEFVKVIGIIIGFTACGVAVMCGIVYIIGNHV